MTQEMGYVATKTDFVLVDSDFVDKLQLRKKQVLVRCEPFNYQLASGLFVDPNYEPHKHRVTKARVVARAEPVTNVVVGDVVHFHYLTLESAEGDGKCFATLNFGMLTRYYLVDCNEVYCRVRNNEITMLNGWALVEPFYPKKFADLPHFRGVHHDKIGILKKLPEGEEWGCVPGDFILFLADADIPMEYEIHQTLGGKFFRMREDCVIAVVAADAAETVPMKTLKHVTPDEVFDAIDREIDRENTERMRVESKQKPKARTIYHFQ